MSEHRVNNIPWWYWKIRFDHDAFWAERRRQSLQRLSNLLMPIQAVMRLTGLPRTGF